VSDKGLAGVCEGRATLKPQGRGRARPGTGKGWGKSGTKLSGVEGNQVQMRRRQDREEKEPKALVVITVT